MLQYKYVLSLDLKESEEGGRSDCRRNAAPPFGGMHSKCTITPELRSGAGTAYLSELGVEKGIERSDI